MRRNTIARILGVAALSLASALAAQQNTNPAPGRRGGGRQPCFQQVGISPSVMQQIRETRQNLRPQMEAVCSNPSLSNEQKRVKLRDLRQSLQQQMNALITPEQQEALRTCQGERMGGTAGGLHPGTPAGAGREGFNPCAQFGEVTPPAAKTPPSSTSSGANAPPNTDTPPSADTPPPQ